MENRKLKEELKETRQDRDHATARFAMVNAENRRLHEEIQRLRDIEP
jgi:formate-dependent nitrite reductase cytochrome c552 subunit